MPSPLYLDTARLGQFNKHASLSHEAFLHLIGETPTEPSLVPFLIGGASEWHEHSVARSSVLTGWKGVSNLERLLAAPFQAPEHSPVYLASRSTTLIRMGIDQLFKHCRRCLTVDMCWPSYLLDLQHAASRIEANIVIAPIRNKILNEQLDAKSLCEFICHFYVENQCDGLFLPVVDHLGVRLPVRKIVDQLRNRGYDVRFILLDAAQAYSHVSLSEDSKVADMIVAGTHKWLGSYFPLGVAISPNLYSSASIANAMTYALLRNDFDDSLCAFMQQLKGERTARPETVNLGPLFSAYGAVQSFRHVDEGVLAVRRKNADIVSTRAIESGWIPRRPHRDFRTGIVLLEPPPRFADSKIADRIEKSIRSQSIYVSVYENGMLRLAMPGQLLTYEELDRLGAALNFNADPIRSPSLLRESDPTSRRLSLQAG